MRILHNLILSILLWRQKRGKEYLFKKWITLENLKEKIIKAVQDKSPEFPDYLFSYLCTALGVSSIWYEQADWIKIVEAFYICLSKAPSIKLPITSPTNEKFNDEPWHYDNRSWYLYSHIIAQSYGWTLEYISQLQVQQALATIQEIVTDKQLEREFYYGLSEIAYPYNEQSKKSIFKPLDRPHWMRPKIAPVPRFNIPLSMMPQGVVKIDGVLPEELLPKTPVH